MKTILITLTFLLFLIPSVTHALVLTVKESNTILWKDKDAFDDCVDEKEATGKYGHICRSGVTAILDAGTKLQHKGGYVLGYKVKVLSGKYVGVAGWIPSHQATR